MAKWLSNEENIDKIFIQENDVNQDRRNNIDKILLKPSLKILTN